jgi:hypothetical protein
MLHSAVLMDRYIARVAFIFSVLLLTAGAIGIWQWRSIALMVEGLQDSRVEANTTESLATTQDVLNYLVANPEQAAIVAYDVSLPMEGIYYQPERRQPVASTLKLLVLAEYARQVEAGLLSPEEGVDVAAIEELAFQSQEHYEQLWAELRSQGYVNASGQVAMKALPQVMMVDDDQAVTDYLMLRLGRDQMAQIPMRLGLLNQEAPLPILGQFLSWKDDRLAADPQVRLKQIEQMRFQAYGDRVYQLVERWQTDTNFREQVRSEKQTNRWLSEKEQTAFVQTSFKGFPGEYASLMERIVTNSAISPTVSQIMQSYLGWAMQYPEAQAHFDALGIQGGHLPGVYTETMYALPKGTGRPRVVTVFLNHLPASVEAKLVDTGLLQKFQLQLLTDPAFFIEVRDRLKDRGGSS